MTTPEPLKAYPDLLLSYTFARQRLEAAHKRPNCSNCTFAAELTKLNTTYAALVRQRQETKAANARLQPRAR